MAFIPVPNTVKVAFVYNIGTQEVINTLYFEYTGGSVDAAYLDGLALSMELWWSTYMQDRVGSGGSLNRIELKDLTAEDSFVKIVTVNEDGDAAGAIAPLNVTKRINFGTGLGGRSFRGANYWPYSLTSELSGSYYVASNVNLYVSVYLQFLPSGALALPVDTQWVVVSTVSNGAPRVTGLTTPITNVYVSGLDVDSMRSRIDP